MSINTVALINLLGFTTGAVLYAMLLVMVLRRPAQYPRPHETDAGIMPRAFSTNGLLFATAVLGLLWNVGALTTYGVRDFGVGEPVPLLVALSFSALGFLPAVVVHQAMHSHDAAKELLGAKWIKVAAYALSGAAGLMHFYTLVSAGGGPSDEALRTLTVGYLLLLAALFVSTRRQPGWKRAVWGSALAVFAVSALHLSQHHYGGAENWSAELLGHHASLPLALAILYQDYRFAFADIFLKRALALLMLVGLTLSLFLFAASPLLSMRDGRGQPDPRAVGALLGLWVVTAHLYPWLSRAAVRFVDSVVLRRADYGELRSRIARYVGKLETTDEVLDEVCRCLAPALSARGVRWSPVGHPSDDPASSVPLPGTNGGTHAPRESVELFSRAGGLDPQIPATGGEDVVTLLDRFSAAVHVPTTEPPHYRLVIGELAGGRRLLSGDIGMLEAVAVIAARRIDALRVAHERCEQVSREQEIGKLATEAQLRALRAQVNPHFLFNALTTIGYLIKAAPDRALDTLMKLTDLLRRVLRSTGEFATLDEELKLIASYLDIESARFEERLQVSIDVPPELLSIQLPSLLVQPLVENAIKHGISPAKYGGAVAISAQLEGRGNGIAGGRGMMSIVVSDTGIGAGEMEISRGRRRGVGLNNVEERLRCYYGPAASLIVVSVPGEGTRAELTLPVSSSKQSKPATAEAEARAANIAGEGWRRER